MTKRELSQLYWLNREIEEDKRKLTELEAAAEGGTAKITGMPHVSGNGRSIENYTVLIAEQRDMGGGLVVRGNRQVVEQHSMEQFALVVMNGLLLNTTTAQTAARRCARWRKERIENDRQENEEAADGG